MKKNLIKITALALTVLLAVPNFTGCGRMREDGATLELSMENSWRTERTLTGLSHKMVLAVGNDALCFKTMTNGEEEFALYDLQTGKYERFLAKSAESLEGVERISSVPFNLPDGTVGIMNMIYQGKGGGAIEIHRRTMDVYDTQMNFIETREVPVDFPGDSFYNRNLITQDSKGNWYVNSTVYNEKFQKYGDIDVPYSDPNMVFRGADGAVYVEASIWNSEGTGFVQKVYRLDAEARTCEDIGIYTSGARRFATGTKGYNFYYITNTGLYGVKEKEATELINWVNSDISVNDVWEFYALENGDFVLYLDGNKKEFRYASPRTQEEIDSTKLISLATVHLNQDLMENIINYNREESGYRIVTKDYSQFNTPDDPNLGYETMKKDMLDGKVADIICTDGVNFESLANKGLFADWYKIMDADEEFDRSDYLQNFFAAYEYDDKLQRLSPFYYITTSAAKTSHVGETQGLSLQEQLDLPLPDGMRRIQLHPSEILAQTYLYNLQTGCIDPKKAQCCFDSPAFVAFLEALNEIPMSDHFYEEYQEPLGSENVWKADYVLIYDFDIHQPIDLHTMYRGIYFDEPVTLIGRPMEWDEGNGGVFNVPFSLSVNAQSTEKDAIWDFVKHLLSEDYQKKMTSYLPIHEGALAYKLDEAEHMVTATSGYYPNVVQIGEMKEWETDLLNDYIHGIRTGAYYDYKVHAILMEEAEKMLHGDQTPQEAAKMMQSRVSIYLSEQS